MKSCTSNGVPANEALAAVARRYADRTVVVIGSAPSVVVPWDEAGAIVVAANGGAYVAHGAGLPVDDLVTTSYFCRRTTAHQRATVARWHGLRLDTLWVDLTDGDVAPVQQACRDEDLEYGRLYGLTRAHRQQLVEQACGLPLGAGPQDRRVSSGVFAVCLVLAGGAARVVVAGLSMTGGHAELDPDSPRPHLPADRECLLALAARVETSGRLATTQQELHSRFGFTLLERAA